MNFCRIISRSFQNEFSFTYIFPKNSNRNSTQEFILIMKAVRIKIGVRNFTR